MKHTVCPSEILISFGANENPAVVTVTSHGVTVVPIVVGTLWQVQLLLVAAPTAMHCAGEYALHGSGHG